MYRATVKTSQAAGRPATTVDRCGGYEDAAAATAAAAAAAADVAYVGSTRVTNPSDDATHYADYWIVSARPTGIVAAR